MLLSMHLQWYGHNIGRLLRNGLEEVHDVVAIFEFGISLLVCYVFRIFLIVVCSLFINI